MHQRFAETATSVLLLHTNRNWAFVIATRLRRRATSPGWHNHTARAAPARSIALQPGTYPRPVTCAQRQALRPALSLCVAHGVFGRGIIGDVGATAPKQAQQGTARIIVEDADPDAIVDDDLDGPAAKFIAEDTANLMLLNRAEHPIDPERHRSPEQDDEAVNHDAHPPWRGLTDHHRLAVRATAYPVLRRLDR